jgi:hypothetical protein
MRTERADGFHYNASWHRDGNTYLDTFPADRVPQHRRLVPRPRLTLGGLPSPRGQT